MFPLSLPKFQSKHSARNRTLHDISVVYLQLSNGLTYIIRYIFFFNYTISSYLRVKFYLCKICISIVFTTAWEADHMPVRGTNQNVNWKYMGLNVFFFSTNKKWHQQITTVPQKQIFSMLRKVFLDMTESSLIHSVLQNYSHFHSMKKITQWNGISS